MRRSTASMRWQRRSVSRRRFLNGTLSFGLGAVGLTLLGCAGDDETSPTVDSETDADARTDQEQPEPVDELVEEPTDEPEDGPADGPAEEPADEPGDESADGPDGEMATITPSADTTLYRENDNSNGAGKHFFTGLTASAQERRALLRFDLQIIPAGAVVTQVELTLALSRTSSGAIPISLHRLTRGWGEAGSDAPDTEGQGTSAAAGDATWTYAIFDTESWAAPGGDFVAAPSALTSVDQIGTYSWSGAGLVTDVQDWLSGDVSNDGWILLADELIQPSTKRFDSRESANPPSLAVTFEVG